MKKAKLSRIERTKAGKAKQRIVIREKNPRRLGTRAQRAYRAMIKIPTRARTVAAARVVGYRSNDLRWDLARGHIDIR